MKAASLLPRSSVQVAAPVGLLRRIVLVGPLDEAIEAIRFSIHGVLMLEIGPSQSWDHYGAASGGQVARQLANLSGAFAGPLTLDLERGLTIPEATNPAGILTVCGSDRMRRPCGLSVLFLLDQ